MAELYRIFIMVASILGGKLAILGVKLDPPGLQSRIRTPRGSAMINRYQPAGGICGMHIGNNYLLLKL